MSYEWEGRQYVVIAAGGRSDTPVPISDSIVAFALPRPGDPGRGWLERILDRPGGRFEAGASLGLLALVLVAWAIQRLRSARRRRKQARSS
jgi:quinoprotein glucose dehydrogenase